ncbi:deoxyhypusine monooxygenase [Saccharomycopsis crataegensis]|uniref:Deoxyhypusine hydroxylase n=1 Tax=Saccharomycopsis crataegensis TaxID=43959 RepID=A0AAV5QVH5_9ASCO|nr:deoxyhypusine monooxygenase [Saccharomycopsis crataegensis]
MNNYKVEKIDWDAPEEPVTEVVENLEELRDVLVNQNGKESLAARFRVLFTLKSIGESFTNDVARANTAIDYINQAFADNSELLKHEVAYVLGQTKNLHATKYLRDVLSDTDQQCMVRHEAAEALGALGDEDSLNLLTEFFKNDPLVEIRETCELAIERIKWQKEQQKQKEELESSLYSSIDPAPPLPIDNKHSVAELQKILNDQDVPLFKRYRAMFTLRDIGNDEACMALATGFADKSALFKHEIAYIFGQICNPVVVPDLIKVLNDESEAPMVRHEAAEALGDIDSSEVIPILKKHLTDKNTVVKESAIVALDMNEEYQVD